MNRGAIMTVAMIMTVATTAIGGMIMITETRTTAAELLW
jgi:hypothetical protein